MGSWNLEQVYRRIWSAHDGELYVELDRSLQPRPPEMLYDLAGQLGLKPGWSVLDAGSGRGNHACELARRFGCRVCALDPLEPHARMARTASAKHGVGGRVRVLRGGLEAIPFADQCFDMIWCRDVLVHVPDLAGALAECARVLRPGGAMLLYTICGTGLLEPNEAARLCAALQVVVENLSQARVESALLKSGFVLLSTEVLGSEVMEYYEDRDRRGSRELLRIARMLRARDRFIAWLGEENYQVALALYHWTVYDLLGKLTAVVYTLRKAGGASLLPR